MHLVNVRGTFPATPVSHGSCGALGRAPIFSTDIDSVVGSDRHSRMRRINGCHRRPARSFGFTVVTLRTLSREGLGPFATQPPKKRRRSKRRSNA